MKTGTISEKDLPDQSNFEAKFWFPTPIWTGQISDYARLNAEILMVMQLLENESDSLSRSNIGGWHSNSQLHLRDDMAEIRQAFGTACRHCARVLAFDFDNFELTINEMWLNRNGPGDLNKTHIHPHAMLSGAYYVKVPENSGKIEFLDPVLARVATAYPKAESRPVNAISAEYTPVEGFLVIFPSWLQHWVQPNRGDDDRVSISFNVGYRPINRTSDSDGASKTS